MRIEHSNKKSWIRERELLVQQPYPGHNPKGLWVVVRLPTDGELCLL